MRLSKRDAFSAEVSETANKYQKISHVGIFAQTITMSAYVVFQSLFIVVLVLANLLFGLHVNVFSAILWGCWFVVWTTPACMEFVLGIRHVYTDSFIQSTFTRAHPHAHPHRHTHNIACFHGRATCRAVQKTEGFP